MLPLGQMVFVGDSFLCCFSPNKALSVASATCLTSFGWQGMDAGSWLYMLSHVHLGSQQTTLKQKWSIKYIAYEASKMVLWVKMLSTKSDNLCSIPRTHLIDREKGPSQVVCWHLLPSHIMTCTPTYTFCKYKQSFQRYSVIYLEEIASWKQTLWGNSCEELTSEINGLLSLNPPLWIISSSFILFY